MTSSDSYFLVLHALRLKGIADPATVSDQTGLPEDRAVELLQRARAREEALFREGRRGGFRLTEPGRAAHARLLAEDCRGSVRAAYEQAYARFLPLNSRLKQVCSDWQIREGAPNDHQDSDYDRAVVDALVALDAEAQTVLRDAGAASDRLARYGVRLGEAVRRVVAGDLAAFARPMARSYHDAWMELHQDLLLSLGRERGDADGH